MSIEALILGTLHKPAEQRTAATTGRPYVSAVVRAAIGDGEAAFVRVVAFSESAGTALLALDAGDSVALAGALKVGVWTNQEGVARPSLDLVANNVMTTYGLAKKRKAVADAGAGDGDPGAGAGEARLDGGAP